MVVTGSSWRRNPQGTADFGELCSTIRCEDRGKAKPRNPRDKKCSDTGFSSDGAQWSHLWPMCCPWQSCRGTRGRRDPEDMPQSTEEALRETKTRLRDGVESILVTEGQDCWMVEKWRKLKVEREGSERTGRSLAKTNGGGLGGLETPEKRLKEKRWDQEKVWRASATTLSTPGTWTSRAGKLSQVGQFALLLGGPRQRNLEQGKC